MYEITLYTTGENLDALKYVWYTHVMFISHSLSKNFLVLYIGHCQEKTSGRYYTEIKKSKL